MILPEFCLNQFQNRRCENFEVVAQYARDKYNYYEQLQISDNQSQSVIMCGEIENYFQTHDHS